MVVQRHPVAPGDQFDFLLHQSVSGSLESDFSTTHWIGRLHAKSPSPCGESPNSKSGRSQSRRGYPNLFEEEVWESHTLRGRILHHSFFRKGKVLQIGGLHHPFEPPHYSDRRNLGFPLWIQRTCLDLRRGDSGSDFFAYKR